MTEKSAADRVLELEERLKAAKPKTPEQYYASRRYESACVNLAPALARQVKELESEREWQPIDTAPKDGTRVLLGRFTGNKKARREGFRAIDWYRQPKDGAGYVGFGSFNPEHWPPTHWKPLPEPPK